MSAPEIRLSPEGHAVLRLPVPAHGGQTWLRVVLPDDNGQMLHVALLDDGEVAGWPAYVAPGGAS